MGSPKKVTATCPGEFSARVWDALRHDARVIDPEWVYDVRRSTFEFTTNDDPDAVLGSTVFALCNVRWSVADA